MSGVKSGAMDGASLQQQLLGQNAGPFVDPSAPEWLRLVQAHRVELFAAAACVALMALVFELVRRNRIKEKYSLLWFATGGSLLVLTLKRSWLNVLAREIGIYYPPTALFLVLNLFLILILVHFSMVISRLIAQNQRLAQEVAILRGEVEMSRRASKEKNNGSAKPAA